MQHALASSSHRSNTYLGLSLNPANNDRHNHGTTSSPFEPAPRHSRLPDAKLHPSRDGLPIPAASLHR